MSTNNKSTSNLVSVVRIASTNSDTIQKFRNVMTSYFLKKYNQEDNNNGDNTHVLNFSNKYFNAQVLLLELLENTTMHNTKEDGIILLFDASCGGSSSTAHSFDSLTKLNIDSSCSPPPGELLRLCIGIDFNGNNNNSNNYNNTKEYENEYSRRILWCLDHGYEYIEYADCSSKGQESGHDERDKEGFARIIEAIEGTVWSSATMKKKQQTLIKQSYKETRTHLQSIPSSSSASKEEKEHKEKEEKTQLKSDDDNNDYHNTCNQKLINEEEDKIREEQARKAIYEQSNIQELAVEQQHNSTLENDDMKENKKHGNDKQQQNSSTNSKNSITEENSEVLFNQFEGALREATKIREASRKGELSDTERKQRAEDAAMLLMGLMNQMGGFESDDEDEDNHESENEIQQKEKDKSEEQQQQVVSEQLQ